MNKQRREELLDVTQLLEDAMSRLSEIRDDEQDAFDNMPEGLQYSVRGDAMMEAIDTMNEFEDDIESVRTKIEAYAMPKKNK